MIGYAPAWAVWLALGLWGVALVLGAVVFVMGRRLWRQLGPSLAPLLSMFAGGHGVQRDAGTSASPGADTGVSAGHETPAGE